MRLTSRYVVLLLLWSACPALTMACVLCNGQGPPLAREIRQAKVVVFGRITDARLGPDGISGTSELAVESVLQGDQSQIKQGKLTLNKYIPSVPGIKYLIFLDKSQEQWDAYRSIVCSTDRLVNYLRKMPGLTDTGTPEQRQARLKYTFDFFQDTEPEIAADAYKEWSVASNQDVAAVAGQLSAEKLRRWLLDSKTPSHCLALYAYLLGASGQQTDIDLLGKLASTPPDIRYSAALDGLLAGVVRQQPDQAWSIARDIISDNKRTFSERHALLRFLRFQRDVGGEPAHKEINRCLEAMLTQPDVMDLAIEQMRQWKLWGQQAGIFKLYDSPLAAAPISKRSIVRYALDCPGDSAKSFVAGIRKKEPELIKDVEEMMQLTEKP